MMTSFGKWLGKSNGDTMLSDCFEDATKEQARAIVTTYCIIFGIEVDTFEWDELMRQIWNCYNSWFDEYEQMDDYMSELLV